MYELPCNELRAMRAGLKTSRASTLDSAARRAARDVVDGPERTCHWKVRERGGCVSPHAIQSGLAHEKTGHIDYLGPCSGSNVATTTDVRQRALLNGDSYAILLFSHARRVNVA